MGFLMRVWLIVVLLLAGCASTPKGPLSLQQQLEHPSTITLELLKLENESKLLVVKAGLPNGDEGRFAIDTGATLSTIYTDVQRRLGLTTSERTAIRVHGMIASRLQPITEMPSLTLDQTELPPFRVAVLPRQEGETGNKRFERPEHEGIIGMDLLSGFHLYIDWPNQMISFIPIALGPANLPANWDVVELTRNPFLDDGRELRFFQLRLGNNLTPALLDTGAQFNFMNWNTDRFPQLRAARKQLRKDWELKGAVGTFQPVSKILSKNARAGQKFWNGNEFIVLDFESLDVLGIDGKPFVIAGIPMFSEEAVLIDFESDRLYFAPNNRRPVDVITVY